MQPPGRRAPIDFGRLTGALVLVVVAGCASAESDSGSARGSAGSGGSLNPWVSGGQTGALMPACGLTASAERGDAIPAGDGGIVIKLDGCAQGFDVSALMLADSDGVAIDFDVERLDDGTVLLRPRVDLDEGTYTLDGDQVGPTPVRVGDAAALPSTLGTLSPEAPICGASFTLDLDPLLLEYLPSLKLSASVDGTPAETWFDYGALEVTGGEARITLPECLGTCLGDGTHELELVAELAGELGTLEPISVDFEVDCSDDTAGDTHTGTGACNVAAPRQRPPWLAMAPPGLAWLWRRRRKRRPR